MKARHPAEDAFQRQLAIARQAHGLTLRDLAVQSCVPFNSISRAERGLTISFGHALRLAKTLGISLDELARRQDDHAGSVWECDHPECGFDSTCGDCVEGRCHWGGDRSRKSIEAAQAGREYVDPVYGHCGCAEHEASVRARQRHSESCPLCGGAGVVPGTEEPETNTAGEPCDCVLRGES